MSPRRDRHSIPVIVVMAAALMTLWPSWGTANSPAAPYLFHRIQSVPILGVTFAKNEPVGTMTRLNLSFEQRSDRTGLMMVFLSGGGRLSPKAETSVQQAIYRVARAAGLSTDSWTVTLSVPEGVTVYGDSLSAMVGLTVIACAKGEPVPADRVVTGGITPDGHISPVGGLSYKIAAAWQAQIRRVIVPDEAAAGEGDWQTPFLMQVSPVHSLAQAYLALTDHPLQ
jgi:hypothetical protein